MDTKVLIESVAKTLDRQPKDISALLTGMTNVIRDHLSEMDSVAIPGFGEFEPIKHEEEIQPDLSTGKLMLLPPTITVEFHPSSLLRRKLSEAQ